MCAFGEHDAVETRRFWSGTYGSPGAYAEVQYDGNFVVYAQDGHALWATGTWGWA